MKHTMLCSQVFVIDFPNGDLLIGGCVYVEERLQYNAKLAWL